MILVINICKEKSHYFEFVKPILNIIKENELSYFIRNYKSVNKRDLNKCSKIIICGTSLSDNDFITNENIRYFKWILNFDKPILGICGGMQIIGKIFGGKILRKSEIGFFKEKFNKKFLGIFGFVEVYHLHNNYIDFSKLKDFDVYCSKKISQAVKHKNKEIYAVLFHPEVRQKDLIKNFCLSN
jgi:GMP synthase-like glutamine amidotransferase